jgi:subtilisin family serine protease
MLLVDATCGASAVVVLIDRRHNGRCALQHRRKILTAILGIGLVLGSGQVGLAAPPAQRPAGITTQTTAAHRASYTVTLLTGDRVTVSSPDAASAVVQPAKGREHVAFRMLHYRHDLYVIPSDALGPIADGRVDRRLFDVSTLVRDGLDDRGSAVLPLIVQYRTGLARPNAAALGGARVTRDLPAVHGAALSASKSQASKVWSTLPGSVGHLWLDGRRKVALDQSVPQIGGPIAWAAGYTGKGVTVAVLDTGIDSNHPDLTGKVLEAVNFTDAPDTTDTVGHGTHVAGIIAGTGAASNGKYKGVAPDATLLSGKVCADEFCDDSAILAGMQWAASEKHATVVNLSLGGGDTPDIDPLEEAVNTLTAQYGTLFVIAAGNDGPGDATVSSPGSADAALTVGAVDKSDQLAFFSSVGPRIGDDAVKPDLTAPGVDIVSARAAGSTIGDPVGDFYQRLSGTSMATPHVTGSVAILAQEHPDWSAAQFKATLVGSAKPNPDLTGYQQGAGRVDVGRAISQAVTADPVSLSFGKQVFPHTDDQPIAKTLTYHNSGATEVSLDLAVHAAGPDGATPPAGLFSLSAAHITVPAGGDAKVTVTADTSVGGPDGLWSGELIATGGATQVSTAFGVNKEVESYDVTINSLDRSGQLTGDSFPTLVGNDVNFFDFPYDPSGTIKTRVPKGSYDLSTVMFSENGDQVMLAQPLLDVTHDVTVTLDARTARPVSVTVPEPSAQVILAVVSYGHATSLGGFASALLSFTFDGLFAARQGPALPAGQEYGEVGSQWAQLDGDGSGAESPYVYATENFIPGGLPTGFVRHYTARDLATVRTDVGAVAPDGLGLIFSSATGPFFTGGWATAFPQTLPRTVTRYLNAGPAWSSEVDTGTIDSDGFLEPIQFNLQAPTVYKAGHKYSEQWDRAPFGFAFPTPAFEGDFITRFGDSFLVDPPYTTDGAGHQGWSIVDSGSIKVYRDGVLVGSVDGPSAFIDVPPDPGAYRIEMQANRSGFDGLTSAVSAAWTFRSGHVSDDTFTSLPVSAVRFTPLLAADNSAPGGVFTVPVSVQSQPGGGSGRVKDLKVQVSYDDGATWTTVDLKRSDDNMWVATLHQPHSGFVSMRAFGADTAGNTFAQTIIHLYKLR